MMKHKYCERNCPFKRAGKCNPEFCHIGSLEEPPVKDALSRITDIDLRAHIIEHCEFIVVGKGVWMTHANDEEQKHYDGIRKEMGFDPHIVIPISKCEGCDHNHGMFCTAGLGGCVLGKNTENNIQKEGDI